MHIMLRFATVVALLAAGLARVHEDFIITPDDGSPGDRFGTAIGISGNLLVAGARDNDEGGNRSGSAYVFATADGGSSWTQKAKLVAPDAAAVDEYGYSVAVDGDTIAVGAWLEDENGVDSGSVYIHKTTDGGDTWSAGTKISAADGAGSDFFGSAVSVQGNVVAVGARGNDDDGSASGSVYVFTTTDGTNWLQSVLLTANDATSSSSFGNAVDIEDTVMVIGAYGADAVYVFTTSDGGSNWSQVFLLTANDGVSGDRFGWSVHVSGNIIAVGADENDEAASNGGAVYTFTTDNDPGNWEQSAKLTSDSPSTGDHFGTSVALSGNLLVVGAPNADNDEGLAFVFATDNGGDTWTLYEKLSGSDASSNYYFTIGFVGSQVGTTVAVEGNLVLAGASEYGGGGDLVGAVYAHVSDYVPPATQSETATHTASATASATADAGSIGDPILVDFAGHRFMGGSRGRTEYLLYRSSDDAEAITMTTGSDQGTEGGFFATGVSVSQAGCGSVQILALTDHAADIAGDACMTSRIARGDEGLVLIPIGHGGDAGSVLAVYPHQQGDSPAFVNLKLLGTTAAFRAGCTGMLCNEAHADIEA